METNNNWSKFAYQMDSLTTEIFTAYNLDLMDSMDFVSETAGMVTSISDERVSFHDVREGVLRFASSLLDRRHERSRPQGD